MSSQVGSAHIAIFPVMKGFRSKVAREFDGAATDGKSRFQRAFGRTGTETGAKLGREFKAAFGRTDLATPGLRKLSQESTKAARALSSARMKQSDAAGRVRTAEARLSAAQTASKSAATALTEAEKAATQARERYGAGSRQAQSAERRLETARNRVASTSSRVVSAEESLASAQRRSAAATEQVDSASKRLTQAKQALQQATRAAGDEATRSASKFGVFSKTANSFRSGWQGVLGPATSGIQGFAQRAGSSLRAVADVASSTAQRVIAPFRPVASRISSLMRPIGNAFAPIGRSAISAGKTIATHIGGALKTTGKTALAVAGIIAGAFATSISSAISRVDTLNAYPKMMRNLGYSTEEAEKSIRKLSDGIQGLPTALNDIASTTTILAPLTDSLDEATELSIALNNAFMGGGKGAADASRGLEQYSQMLAVGQVDMMAWRTLQETMPGPLNQLSQALLGAESNSTDLYEAMKSGQVTFDDFNEAVLALNKEGINGFASFEEQARDATTGIATSWANVRTALTKGTADILEAIGVENITGALSRVQAAIGRLAKGIAGTIEILAYGKYNPANWPGFDENSPVIQFFFKLREAITGLVSAAGGPLSGFGALAAGALAPLARHIPIIGRAFTGLTGPVGIVIGLFAAMFAESQVLRDAIGGLVESVGGALGGAFEELQPTLEPVIDALMELIGLLGDTLGEVIMALTPVLSELITIFAQAAADILPQLLPVLSQIGGLFANLVSVIIEFLVPALEGLIPVVQNVFGGISEIVQSALELIGGIVQTVMAVINGDWSAAWEGIKQTVSAAWTLIRSIIGTALEAVIGVIGAALEFISGLWSRIWGTISSVASRIWEEIKRVVSNGIQAARDVISNILGQIRQKWDEAWSTLRRIVTEAWTRIRDGVSNGITSVLNLIRELPQRILNALGNLGSLLFESGKSLLSGFANGIRSAFSSVKNTVSSGLSSLRNLFPFSPAKEGPFSGRGWVEYSGEALAEDFGAGIRQRIPVAYAAAHDLALATSSALNTTPGRFTHANTPGGPAPWASTSPGITFHIGAINNPQVETTSTTISRELQRVAAGVGSLV